MSEPMTKERLAELRAECLSDWGGLSPDAGNEVLNEIERIKRERDEAREALLWYASGCLDQDEPPEIRAAYNAADAARAAGEEKQ